MNASSKYTDEDGRADALDIVLALLLRVNICSMKPSATMFTLWFRGTRVDGRHLP